MDAIEGHVQGEIEQALLARGVAGAKVVVHTAAAERWGFQVTKAGRTFEARFNPREGLWAAETTIGRSSQLTSNDTFRTTDTTVAWAKALALIANAASGPPRFQRDPPTI